MQAWHTSDRGSSLLEALIAAGVFSVAVVGVVQLAALSVGLHADAEEMSRAVWHADDVLRSLRDTARHGDVGGDLDANSPGFFDHPEPGLTRRWTVGPGPVPGTRAIVVRVLNKRARRVGRTLMVSSLVATESAW